MKELSKQILLNLVSGQNLLIAFLKYLYICYFQALCNSDSQWVFCRSAICALPSKVAIIHEQIGIKN